MSADALDERWGLLASLPANDPERARARAELIETHLPLVNYLARRYSQRGERFDDLAQVGAVGLIKSVDRFDPTRGIAFSTFATPTILGEIKRHFRDKAWMVRAPRALQELRAQIATAREDLSQRLGRAPTIAEIAAQLEVSEEQVIEGIDAANAYSAASLDTPTGDDENPVRGAIEARLGAVDPGIDLVERRESVAPLLDALPERERQIIFLRFFREKTQAEIGAELGISQMHVSRILSRTLETLQRQVLGDAAQAAA